MDQPKYSNHGRHLILFCCFLYDHQTDSRAFLGTVYSLWGAEDMIVCLGENGRSICIINTLNSIEQDFMINATYTDLL